MTTTKAMENATLFASRNYSKSEAKTEKSDLFSQFLDMGSLKTTSETSLPKTSIVNVAKNKIASYDNNNSEMQDKAFEVNEKSDKRSQDVEQVDNKSKLSKKEDRVEDIEDKVKNEEPVEDSVEEPLDKKILKLSKELKEKLCKALNISPEELDELLADSQLTILSLFNQENLMEFSMMLSGTENMSQILTNEDALKILQTVTQVVDEIDVEQLTGIPKEEFSQLVTDVLEGNYNTQPKDNDLSNQMISKVTDEKPVTEELIENAPVAEEMNVENQDNELNGERNTDRVEASQEEKTLTIDVDKDSNTNEGATSKNGNESNANATLDAFTENLTVALNQAVTTKEVNFAGQIAHVREVKQVIDQIVTQIKVTVTKDTQSIQMMLNPENLGRVNMTITSKNGVMTAQFVVESEAAKEAIEGQIKLLIENLNDQGLKVEELEVTTREFAFNQQDSSESQSQQNSKSKKTFRTDFFAEDVTQTEEVEEISQGNNTVSYRA